MANMNKLKFQSNKENTPLQICWGAATIKNFATKFPEECHSVDIVSLCDEIQTLSSETKGRHQHILYLTSQLTFGALKIFQAEVDSCLKECENLSECLSRPATQERKKVPKNVNKKNVKANDPVEDSPKIPEISEIDIFSLLEKDLGKDTNLIEEINFPPEQMSDLSFQFSNDAEFDDVAMQETLTRDLQRMPSISTGRSPQRKEVLYTGNTESPLVPENNIFMDEHRTPPKKKDLQNLHRKLVNTPRKTRSKLKESNNLTPESARTAFSPSSSRDILPHPRSPLLAVSPTFGGKRKRLPTAFGQDVTFLEPVTTAAVPTDSPQQSRLPMECATPPGLFPKNLEAPESLSENNEVTSASISQREEENDESTVKNDEVSQSVSVDKKTSVYEESEKSINSFSQRTTDRSQKITTKNDDKIVGRRSRTKKRIFRDLELRINEDDFRKNLNNLNFMTKRRKNAFVTSIISSQSSVSDLLSLQHPLQYGNISNRLMQLYKRDIPLPKINSYQYKENQHYNEQIRHQSPSKAIVEECIETPKINLYAENDNMALQDNELNSNVSTLLMSTQVHSNQLTEPVEVASPTTLLSAVNEYSMPSFSLSEHSQRTQTNILSDETANQQQENAEVFHVTKKFKVRDTGLSIHSVDQDVETISFLSLSEFYERVQTFWNESNKVNRRKKGKIAAVFQEIVSPDFNNVYHVIRYLIHCCILERDRKIDLEQEKPYDLLYLLQVYT